MKCLKFAVIGSGWRSLYYGRIAAFYPDRFLLTALLCRTEEKAMRLQKEYGVPAVTSVSACEETHPDFIVIAVDNRSIFAVAREWIHKGYPVLLETPAGMTMEELRELWELRQSHGAKIQVAEQYFCYPSYSASVEVVRRGYLGEAHMVDLSAVHDYHGASLIRRYLNVGFENMKVTGKQYRYPVLETDSRYGAITDGTVKERGRVKVTFEFDGGKTAFYDFDGVQYHSFIRSRHVNVRGVRGELYDWSVRYADENCHIEEKQITCHRTSDDSGIWQVTLGEGADAEILYENPFARGPESTCMPQDETAIAVLMDGMERYIESGIESYPLAEALQDAYVRILMEEAQKEPGCVIESETQVWSPGRS